MTMTTTSRPQSPRRCADPATDIVQLTVKQGEALLRRNSLNDSVSSSMGAGHGCYGPPVEHFPELDLTKCLLPSTVRPFSSSRGCFKPPALEHCNEVL